MTVTVAFKINVILHTLDKLNVWQPLAQDTYLITVKGRVAWEADSNIELRVQDAF